MKRITKHSPYLVMFFIGALFSLACKDAKETKDQAEVEKVIEHKDDLKDAFDPKEYPLIFRRTTLIVRDLKKSLALYKDAMGMKIIYDKILKRPHPTKDGEQDIRLVFLKAVDEYYGVLGLMEYQYGETDKVIEPVHREGFKVQNSIMLFNTNALEEKFPIIENTPGVEIYRSPTLREYPSYDGEGFIRVMVSIFYDPDGFLVEFNEPLDPIKTQ
ncbi:VOC family protein [uncultured Croceitalea sp.]|uniref:VOC family protein n=1 Tax=uncultured Croceitalea sp. TaxID=1798908 RepID=UPI003305D749